MTVINCVKCNDSVLKTGRVDKPEMCIDCKTGLRRKINKIDRNDDRYTKRGKIKNLLHEVPDEAIPEDMALQIEEVADPNIKERQYCVGKIFEVKQITDKEIHELEKDYSEKDRDKIVLKPRYQ